MGKRHNKSWVNFPIFLIELHFKGETSTNIKSRVKKLEHVSYWHIDLKEYTCL